MADRTLRDDSDLDDEYDPDVLWWQGQVECSLCGHGSDGRVRSVVPIPSDQEEPIVPLECSNCHNFTMHPRD